MTAAFEEWGQIFEGSISEEVDVREYSTQKIVDAMRDPLNFINLCLILIAQPSSSIRVRSQSLIFLSKCLKPSIIADFEELQSMWNTTIPPEDRNQIKILICQTMQENNTTISNLSCEIYALIFALEGDNWPDAISNLITMSQNLSLCQYVFKILSEITNLEFNLDFLFNESFYPMYETLMQTAVSVIGLPPEQENISLELRTNAVTFLVNLSKRIEIFFLNPEALMVIFQSLPCSFVVADGDLFQALHNLMLECLRINYDFLPPEDLVRGATPISFLPLFLQYALKSLSSEYEDPHMTNIVLQFWQELAQLEVDKRAIAENEVMIDVSKNLVKAKEQNRTNLLPAPKGLAKYAGQAYEDKQFKQMEAEEKEKVANQLKERFHDLRICRCVSADVLPNLFNYMKEIDENETDVENLDETTPSKCACLTFVSFAMAALEETQQFFCSCFEAAIQETSWVFHNAAAMMMAALSEGKQSQTLIRETLLSDQINGRTLLLQWASVESRPYLRETVIFVLSQLVSNDTSLARDNTIGIDLVLELIKNLTTEFQTNLELQSNQKTELMPIHPQILIRVEELLYRVLISWKYVVYENALLNSFSDILESIKLLIDLSMRIFDSKAIKLSFECLNGLLRSVPLIETIPQQFMEILAQDFAKLFEQPHDGQERLMVTQDPCLISYIQALISNIATIVLRLRKIQPYPITINDFFMNLSSATRIPELHSDALLAVGAVIKWSCGKISHAIAEKALNLAKEGLDSESPEIMCSTCLLISDMFESENSDLYHGESDSLFADYAREFFQILLDFINKISNDIFLMTFFMHAMAAIVNSLRPEDYAEIRTTLFDLLQALRQARLETQTSSDLEHVNLYVEQLANLYTAFVKSFNKEFYAEHSTQEDLWAMETDQLKEMQAFMRQFHLTKEDSPEPPSFHDFFDRTYLTIIDMISNFADKTSRRTNAVLNRAPARQFLSICMKSLRIESPQIKEAAKRIIKKLGST